MPGARSALVLRVRLGLMAALGGAVVAVAAAALTPVLGAGAWYPWRAACVYLAVMMLAVAAIAGGHPHATPGPANRVTAVRAMGAALAAGLIGEPAGPAVAWMAAAAAGTALALDGVDGWLARRSGMASAFGARFDLEIDALLILVLSILVWTHGRAGPWVLAAGLMRYAFVAGGWLWPRLARPLPSSARGKTVAVAATAGLVAGLAPAVPAHTAGAIAAGVVALLAWSFAVDIARLARRAP